MKTYVFIRGGQIVDIREFQDADSAESFGMRAHPGAAILAPIPQSDPDRVRRALASRPAR